MDNIFLRIALGIVLGLLAKGLGDLVIRRIMIMKDRALKQSTIENIITCVIMAAFGGVILWLVDSPAEILYMFILLTIAEAITIIDLHHRLIPNLLVLAILGTTVIFGVPSLFSAEGFPRFDVVSSLIGFVGCFVIFMAPAALSRQIGAGDVKLAAAMGFCLGYMNALYAIVLMGGLILLYVMLQKSTPILTMMKNMIPMGPFLAIAMIAVQLFTRYQMLAVVPV